MAASVMETPHYSSLLAASLLLACVCMCLYVLPCLAPVVSRIEQRAEIEKAINSSE